MDNPTTSCQRKLLSPKSEIVTDHEIYTVTDFKEEDELLISTNEQEQSANNRDGFVEEDDEYIPGKRRKTNNAEGFIINIKSEYDFSSETSAHNSSCQSSTPTSTNARLKVIEATQRKIQSDIDLILQNQNKMLALLSQANPRNIFATPIFPINDVEALERANKCIKDDFHLYTSIIKDIIPEGIQKNFHRLFGTNIVLDYNYDGVKGKKSLKEYKSLMSAIFDAIKKEGYTETEYIKDVRVCMKLLKGRHIKRLYDLKKKNNNVLQ